MIIECRYNKHLNMLLKISPYFTNERRKNLTITDKVKQKIKHGKYTQIEISFFTLPKYIL